jgi:hypothetical protein
MSTAVGRWPAVLVVLGVALVGGGLALTTASPRATSTNLGPSIAAVSASAGPVTPDLRPASGRAPLSDVTGAVPSGLILPRGGEPVPVLPVGVLPTGALQLPERPTTLGWYAAGAAPGDPNGTAVLAGHVDSAAYGAGPLKRLFELQLGDTLDVTDATGAVHRYAIVSRHSYPKADLPAEVFRRDGPAQLAVITCGGAFDRATGHYADNVVVLAAPATG